MAVHKHCYAPIGQIQQGGSRRRETLEATSQAGHYPTSGYLDRELDTDLLSDDPDDPAIADNPIALRH